MSEALKAPFPWFGGKRAVAKEVWQRFGNVKNYVEPFFGSGAVLLGRPEGNEGLETVNDLDGYVANFWRATQRDPETTAAWADSPVNECDLHARHIWLVERKDSLAAQLMADPDYFDARVAGYWVWGLCCWIGGGWCSGKGPWWHDGCDPKQLVHLGTNGQGVNKQLVHLGDNGRALCEWFELLAARLQNVRVACGDWSRVCGPSVTFKHGLTGVFLDPPYADTAKRTADLYAQDSLTVAHDVRKWAIENGDNPKMRIALCGYEGEHEMPTNWERHAWDAGAGFGGQAAERTENGKKERIWFSPHCLRNGQMELAP